MTTAGWPRGTVAFLFTDVEGSTGLWERFPGEMPAAYARHDAILRGAIERHGGVVYKVIGDAIQAAFPGAPAAVSAAMTAQSALSAEAWTLPRPLNVRMALHVCPAVPSPDGDYRTPELNRLGRLLGVSHGGQVLLSAAIAAEARGTLPPGAALLDLGERRLKDLPGAEPIYQLSAPGLPADFPPLATLDARPHDLPEPPSPLIGRDAEVAAVRDAIRDGGARLVTLTGPGGVGKTRLALAAAAGLVDGFADGVRWVPLAPLAGQGLVASTVSAHLDVTEEADQPLVETVAAWLRGRSLLLVLDNCEHLLDEVAEAVATWLEAAPGVSVLATSRGRLRLRAERAVAIAPLALPRADAVGIDEVVATPAGGLLVDRVRAVGASPSDVDAPALATICRLLDGLPLAIELAAARARLYPPAALRSRLERRLGVLTGGARDLPARQRTMRDAIAWSHDLLPPEQQAVFRRLAVFQGGFTLGAAEQVAAGDDRLDTVTAAEALAEQSLVRLFADDVDEPRFDMLATIREFGLEQLAISGEEELVRRRHSEVYLEMAEAAEVGLRGPEQQSWTVRVEQELDNVRSAMAWVLERGDPTVALRIVIGIWRVWSWRGRTLEAVSWLERALAAKADAPPALLAAARTALGRTLIAQGRYDQAETELGLAMALAEQAASDVGLSRTLNGLCHLWYSRGNLEKSLEFGERSVAAARRSGSEYDLGSALSAIAMVHVERGDAAAARATIEECLDLDRRIGDRLGVCTDTYQLGYLALIEHDPRAQTLLEDARRLAVELESDYYIQATADSLGRLAIRQGHRKLAQSRLAESLDLAHRAGDQFAVASSILGLVIMAAQEDPERGARLLGIFGALNAAIGGEAMPSDRPEYEAAIAAASTALGPDAYEAAYRSGRNRPLDEGIAEALAYAKADTPRSDDG